MPLHASELPDWLIEQFRIVTLVCGFQLASPAEARSRTPLMLMAAKEQVVIVQPSISTSLNRPLVCASYTIPPVRLEATHPVAKKIPVLLSAALPPIQRTSPVTSCTVQFLT